MRRTGDLNARRQKIVAGSNIPRRFECANFALKNSFSSPNAIPQALVVLRRRDINAFSSGNRLLKPFVILVQSPSVCVWIRPSELHILNRDVLQEAYGHATL